MHPLKSLLFLVVDGFATASCDTTQTSEPNTERFYGQVWEGKIVRTRDSISSSLPAAQEEFNTSVGFEKYGSINFFGANLGDHSYQYWSYSWSTDQFFMNMNPVEEWYMSPNEDSLYLKYRYSSWDPMTGVTFDWKYQFLLHH